MTSRSWRSPLAATVLLAAALAAPGAKAAGTEPNIRLPAPAADLPAGAGTRSLVLAGGCFWGLQAMFEHVKGVRRVVAGYAGGEAATARYPMVGTGGTGHAESVRIDYDPAEVSYGQLLRLFFSVAHDPTQVGGQGPDEGPQYRSAIFVADDAERRVAEGYMAQVAATGLLHGRIVTTLEPLRAFYPAEGYHQDYLIHHPDNLYIMINDAPKIAALHRVYPDLYRGEAVRVAAE